MYDRNCFGNCVQFEQGYDFKYVIESEMTVFSDLCFLNFEQEYDFKYRYLFVSGIKRDADIETESNVDLTELLGIAGVPTFLFIHQEGEHVLLHFLAWFPG